MGQRRPVPPGFRCNCNHQNPQTDRVISVASVWEMAIKLNNGGLMLSGNIALPDFISQTLIQLKASILDIRCSHALLLETLPRHHGDPFDRMLIAQSIYERMPIVSIDAKLDAYGVKRVW